MSVNIDFLPAGTYYVGDLCYVLSPEQWSEVCRDTTEGCYELSDGTKIAIFRTPYGDGKYETTFGDGASVLVDSGTVGCVEISDIDINRIPHDGAIVALISDVFVPRVGDMNIRFGDIEIYFDIQHDWGDIDENE